jgi:hypothetical protein
MTPEAFAEGVVDAVTEQAERAARDPHSLS